MTRIAILATARVILAGKILIEHVRMHEVLFPIKNNIYK